MLEPARREATLRTVAEAAAVDVSTASRVLNGSESEAERAASPETAERIRRIARELGYRINVQAASLRTRRSNAIGVLVPRISDIVLATIYGGIEDEAARRGLMTFAMNTHDSTAEQRARTEVALDRRVDGLIFGDAHLDSEFFDELHSRGVQFVLVSRRCDGHPSVTCDDVVGGRLVAEHFLNFGHREVAVIACEPHASTGVDRAKGFIDRYAEAGYPIDPRNIVHSHFDSEAGHQGAERILASGSHATAIFAVNDFAAIGAIGALRDHGLRAGADVAVCGFNDTPLARELPIPLTSVRSPMHEMGERALSLLVDILDGQPPRQIRLAPRLEIRASSSPD